jgi:branched-chain amino acid transport system substrate-binding protein
VRRPGIVGVGFAVATFTSIAAGCGKASHAQPLPQSFCSRVVYAGSGKPQYLIVSDLPVRAFEKRETTLKMEGAIRYTLRQHRFMAGKYRVGYQACDDSNPQAGQGDLGRCSANAKTYAKNRSVIGEIGTWNSECSAIEIPIANRAPGGPLAIISPTNTGIGLTHAAAGVASGEPERYYPTRERNFVRLISSDDFAGAANAVLAKQLGFRSVYVLNDGESYGLSTAVPFESAARKLGLKIAGVGRWNVDGSSASFHAVAERVKRSQAQAVFLGGFFCGNCGALLRSLREGRGNSLAILAPDGFFPIENLTQSVGAAVTEGMHISVPGVPPSKLTAAGRRVEAAFGPTDPGSGGPPYAAAAAEVLLDAIGQSDGGRASVTKHLLSSNIEGGILGSFRFDRNGDTTSNPFTIYVGRHGRGIVDRVVIPSHALAGPAPG